MTLVQSPITANWVTKQMNSHTFCRPKNSSFGRLNFEFEENVEISLPVDFWRCFRSTFECNELVNFFQKQKPVCCWTGKMNEIRDLGLFAREALALFGMDEVKLLGDLSRVERGCQTLFEGSFKARATAKTEKEFDTHFEAII